MEILVLNNDYSPMNITSLQKGFNLVFKGKAEVVEHITDEPIVTDNRSYKRPTVIRLLRYIVVPFKKIQLSRQNIFRRDGHKCVYCGSVKDLTIDHVFPRSKGGKNTWKNMVSACFPCNVGKGDTLLEDTDLVLSHQPFVPSYLHFVRKMKTVHDQWNTYVGIVK